MTNQEIFEELEYVKESLTDIKVELVEEIDRQLISKAIELIDFVGWKYEEEVE